MNRRDFIVRIAMAPALAKACDAVDVTSVPESVPSAEDAAVNTSLIVSCPEGWYRKVNEYHLKRYNSHD